MAFVRRNLDEIVAGLPGVNAEVKGQAVALESRMKAIVLPHNKSGHLFRSIEVKRSFKGKDYFVVIEARYAAAVNYGFIHNFSHKHIDGINFIKGAIYGG